MRRQQFGKDPAHQLAIQAMRTPLALLDKEQRRKARNKRKAKRDGVR
jgi:hypothetical protein